MIDTQDMTSVSLIIGIISVLVLAYCIPTIIVNRKNMRLKRQAEQNKKAYQKEVKRIAKEYESSQFLADIFSEIQSASSSFGFLSNDMPIKSVRIHRDNICVSFYDEKIEKYYNKEIKFKDLGYKELTSSEPEIMELGIERNPEEDGFGEALQEKLGDLYYYVADWDDYYHTQARYYIKTKRMFISPKSKLKPTR